MKKIGAYEAKTHLAELLNRVAAGEKLVITRHGVPVALLQPYPEERGTDRVGAVARMRAFGKGRSLGETSLKELLDEGRA